MVTESNVTPLWILPYVFWGFFYILLLSPYSIIKIIHVLPLLTSRGHCFLKNEYANVFFFPLSSEWRSSQWSIFFFFFVTNVKKHEFYRIVQFFFLFCVFCCFGKERVSYQPEVLSTCACLFFVVVLKIYEYIYMKIKSQTPGCLKLNAISCWTMMPFWILSYFLEFFRWSQAIFVLNNMNFAASRGTPDIAYLGNMNCIFVCLWIEYNSR